MIVLDESLAPRKARIEIIPLIDVIFFLLATFVLFTLSLQKIRTIDVDLPVAPPDRLPPEVSTLFVRALETGEYSWKVGTDGVTELVAAQEIRVRLANYKNSVPVPRVLVAGEGRARLGAVIMVLDEVRAAKIKQVSVETVQGTMAR